MSGFHFVVTLASVAQRVLSQYGPDSKREPPNGAERGTPERPPIGIANPNRNNFAKSGSALPLLTLPLKPVSHSGSCG